MDIEDLYKRYCIRLKHTTLSSLLIITIVFGLCHIVVRVLLQVANFHYRFVHVFISDNR